MFETSMLAEAINMFIYLATQLTVLFLVISYAVGVLQIYIPPQKIQAILGSKKGKGYIFAGFLGAITPFCSCSTIPFLKGLLKARAGFGTTMVFLFASPLLNPIIIGLFFATFGIHVTVFYFVVAMGISIVAGYLLEKLGFENYVKEEAYALSPFDASPIACCGTQAPMNQWKRIWLSTWADFKKLLPYLFVGVLSGAMIYGFMPTEFVSRVANENNPFAIPLAAIIGIPLYIRAEAVIPLSAALAAKGMGLGAVMALIIGSAGASLTEVILLKAIFKTPLILAFLFVILGMAVGAGFLYSWLF